MAGKLKPPEKAKFIQIPMTPMIDIIFQLLIFFMLSIKFKDVEGKLQSTMPRHGTIIDDPDRINLNEIRIRLTYDPATQMTTVRAGWMDARQPVGLLARGTRETAQATREKNAPVHSTLKQKVRELHAQALVNQRRHRDYGTPRVIIDATENTPYDHVVGIVNTCKEAGIDVIEFTANPKFTPGARQGK